MWQTSEDYKKLANAQTRTPIPIVQINGIEIDIISLEFKEPRETFIGGFAAKYIVLQIDRDAYLGELIGAEIEPFIQFKGDETRVPIGKFYADKEDVEFDEVKKKYTITAYDKTICFDKRYEHLEWPMTGEVFLAAVCKAVGVNLNTECTSKISYYLKPIQGINVNEKEVISYRQLINEFARFNFCSAHINRLGELEFRSVFINNSISEVITGYDYNDLKIDKSIKPFNSLVYEQKDINDPIFKKDEVSITMHGLTELKITDNVFIDFMNKATQQNYVDEMFSKISGFIYHKFESNLIMRPDYDSCDVLGYEDLDGYLYRVVLTDISWSWIGGGMKGTLKCPQLPETVTKYELAGERQDLLNMSIDVDRVNKKITSLARETGKIQDQNDYLSDRVEDNQTKITQTAERIESEISSRIEMGDKILEETRSVFQQLENQYNFEIVKIIDGLDEMKSWFRIDENGAIIGKSGNPVSVHIGHNVIEFIENGVAVAVMDNQKLRITSVIALMDIIVGNHIIMKYPQSKTITIIKPVEGEMQ